MAKKAEELAKNAKPGDIDKAKEKSQNPDLAKQLEGLKDLQNMAQKAKDPKAQEEAKKALEDFAKKAKEEAAKAKPEDIAKLAKDLKSTDPATREAAKRKLELAQQLSEDKEVRGQAELAMKTGEERPPIDPSGEDKVEGGKANPEYEKKSSALTLRQFKDMVNKDILKDLGMSKEQFDDVLKGLKDRAVREPLDDLLTGEPGTNRKSQGAKAYEYAGPKNKGNTKAGAGGDAPPEFKGSFNRNLKTKTGTTPDSK
jgi:hypothetical protein